MARPGRLLNRNLYLLWQGQTIGQLGTQGFDVALLLWIKHATGSAAIMGVLLMVSSLPALLLGPVAGTIVDRTSRRSILIVCDLVVALATLSLATLVYLAPGATNTILAALFLVSTTMAVTGAFFNPTISAVIPDLAPREKVAAANSLFQSSFQLSTFLGQGLGGTLFRLLGAPLLFLIDGLSYLFAGISASFIDIPRVAPAESKPWRETKAEFKRDLLEGFRYVWRAAGLRNLVLSSAGLSFFTVPVVLLLPFYVEDRLKASDDWYGFMLAAYGIGSLAGYLFAGAARLSGKARVRVTVAFMLAQSVGFALLGMTRSRELAVAMAFAGGFAGGAIQVIVMTLLQVSTPAEIRGRVFALLGTISGSLAPIAMGLTGIVADLLHRDIPRIYVVCGACSAAISILTALSSAFRRFLVCEEAVEQATESQQVIPAR